MKHTKHSNGLFAVILLAHCLSTPLQAAPRGPDTGLVSPFNSTVPGITIRNTHLVASAEGEVIRGMSPSGKTSELAARGVTDILIFKNEIRNEVQKEIAELQENGFTPDRIHVIPFRWKELEGYRTACEQLLTGLQILERAYRTPERSVFFHCTVGEDRTGLLAGLFRMVEQGWSARKAFDQEMCAHGYEAGDGKKPWKVVSAIRTELTPVFLALATLIEDGVIAAGQLDVSVCAQAVQSRYEARDFACKKGGTL